MTAQTLIAVVVVPLSFLFGLAPRPALAQLLPPSVQAGDKVDVVDIHITPCGPWPTTIKHGPGPFILYISNRSSTLVDTYSLVLKPLAPLVAAVTSLLDLHSDANKHHDHQLIVALPGEYQVLFASHPDWVVNIAITVN